jgi:hypothetical protein
MVVVSLVERSVRLVPDEGDDHAVQVEEEHDQVETQLDEGFLILGISDVRLGIIFRFRPTFLCTLSFLKISVASRRCWFSKILSKVSYPAQF